MEAKTQWIYHKDGEKIRYVLGEILDAKQTKSLICIGINPSTAVPEALDTTLKRVQTYAKSNGYGAWYMLNVYAQRAKNPNKIDKVKSEEYIDNNLAEIKEFAKSIKQADVWCAWGANITKRSYLKDCLRDIFDYLKIKEGYNFVQKIPLEKPLTAHPLHPIASIKCEEKLGDFNIKEYIETLKKQ